MEPPGTAVLLGGADCRIWAGSTYRVGRTAIEDQRIGTDLALCGRGVDRHLCGRDTWAR